MNRLYLSIALQVCNWPLRGRLVSSVSGVLAAWVVVGGGTLMKRFLQHAHSAMTCAATFLVVANSSLAATIFESGTLGPTGVTYADLGGAVPGTNINSAVFAGVRFELTQPVVTSQVGGHFVERFAGAFFGAIVELDDANDFPDSTDLSTPDVLGATTLTFPNPSAEVFGNLNVSLDPGWYALVFGSGLFGANGLGGAIRNGTDIGDPSYIAFQVGSGWVSIISTSFDNSHFVLEGTVVPEPSTILVAGLVLLFVAFRRIARRG